MDRRQLATDYLAKPRPITLLVYVALVVLVLTAGAQLFGLGTERDILALAEAVAGLVTVIVGLLLARDAGQLLYDRERSADERSAIVVIARDIGTAQRAAADAAIPGTATARPTQPSLAPIDLNELLPRLLTRAVALAVGLILLGTVLLLGATAETAGPVAMPSTAAPTAVAPGSSAATSSAPPGVTLPPAGSS
jgi:hypothetical protein